MPSQNSAVRSRQPDDARPGDDLSHPRVIGWRGTAALAMGGSNQMLFLISALLIGQGDIPGQGTASILLLLVGLVLSYMSAPGWTELVLMSPNRVGGISAACTEAFRPYSPILSALTGVCYWWGWVPTCGVTAILSGAAIQQWCLPGVPVPVIAIAILSGFTIVNLLGVRYVAGLAIPIACASVVLAFASMIIPIVSGKVDWHRSFDLHLDLPFEGSFGVLTSLMAGLYLIGFGAPAFEAATCHVGETVDPVKNVPRAMRVSGLMAGLYFAVLPAIWLGTLGKTDLAGNLSTTLGPTFAPLLGSGAKSAAIGFMMFNMFHGTLQPLAGAARTLAQLSEDGLAPRFLSKRMSTDTPYLATLVTAGFAIVFLLIGDPIWLIAAANFTYLIGICMPSVAVWLLRRDAPDASRPYRAPRGTIGLGLVAAGAWGASALLGFEQYGLPTVVVGLLMAYSGAFLFGWRRLEERAKGRLRGLTSSVHIKLTGAMLCVLALDAGGYMLAIGALPTADTAFVVALEDIFVAVALLTISVGIILPGMIAHSVEQVSAAARRLANGTVRDLAQAMEALGAGRLDAAIASIDVTPIVVNSRDELGAMADSFNVMQDGIRQAAVGLRQARIGLITSRSDLIESHKALEATLAEQEPGRGPSGRQGGGRTRRDARFAHAPAEPRLLHGARRGGDPPDRGAGRTELLRSLYRSRPLQGHQRQSGAQCRRQPAGRRLGSPALGICGTWVGRRCFLLRRKRKSACPSGRRRIYRLHRGQRAQRRSPTSGGSLPGGTFEAVCAGS